MARKRTYRYYVEPLDEHTNSVLSRELAPKFECEEREFWTRKKAPAWEVPGRRFVNYLKNSKQSLKINFNAFIQEDNYPLRPYPWPIPKKEKLRSREAQKKRFQK